MNQCIRLCQSLVTLSNSRPVDEVKLTTIGIISILGNLRSVNLLVFKSFCFIMNLLVLNSFYIITHKCDFIVKF
jgi:hypothetical protein